MLSQLHETWRVTGPSNISPGHLRKILGNLTVIYFNDFRLPNEYQVWIWYSAHHTTTILPKHIQKKKLDIQQYMHIKLTCPEEAKEYNTAIQYSKTDRSLTINDSEEKLLSCIGQEDSMPQLFENQRNIRHYYY